MDGEVKGYFCFFFAFDGELLAGVFRGKGEGLSARLEEGMSELNHFGGFGK
jgi:hypothetical protein